MDIKERVDQMLNAAHELADAIMNEIDHMPMLDTLEAEMLAIKAHIGVFGNTDNSAQAVSTGTIPSTGLAPEAGVAIVAPADAPVAEGATAPDTVNNTTEVDGEAPATITDPSTGKISDRQEDGSYKERE